MIMNSIPDMQKPIGSIICLGFTVRLVLGNKKINVENMNAVLKRHAPNIEPNGIKAVVLELLDPATMAVTTSLAPLAKAKKVTPAKD